MIRRSHRKRGRGQALVEFALVVPVFLLILMAVFDFGRAVFTYASITNGAREGTRLAIVNQDTTSIAREVLASAPVAPRPASGTVCPGLAPANQPAVFICFRKTTPNADYLTNPTCNAYNNATRPMDLDCVAIVTFRTRYQPLTPIIGNILFASGVSLSATSIETVESVCPSVLIPVAANCPRQP